MNTKLGLPVTGFPISAVEAQASGLVCLLSDRITKEVDLTKNVYHLSIDNGTGAWLKKIEAVPPVSISDRLHVADLIKNAGFDVNNTAEYVRSLYSTNEEKNITK